MRTLSLKRKHSTIPEEFGECEIVASPKIKESEIIQGIVNENVLYNIENVVFTPCSQGRSVAILIKLMTNFPQNQ